MIIRTSLLTFITFIQLNLVFCQQNGEEKKSNSDVKSKTELSDSLAVDNKDKINLLFMGDIMSHDLQIQSAYNKATNTYDFSTEFDYIKPIIKNVDAVVGNLEVTLAGPPYKGYPMFSSPDQMAVDIKNAGIKYLVTANNHINDRGIKGYMRTLDILDSLGLKHTGCFRNAEDKAKRNPMIIDEKGWKIALFNYTYGINGGYYNPKMLINEIDSAKILSDLTEAKKQNYDAIIVFFHWGDEYKRNSNAWQQKIANFCFENGANAVIGSHPHVVQEMEKFTFTTSAGIKKDALVAYSLGNYVANYGSWRYTNGGAMVQFSMQKAPDGQIKIQDQGYYLIWVYRKEKTDTLKTYYVLPISQFENDKMLSGEHLRLFNQFKTDMRIHLNKYNKNVNEYIYEKSIEKWNVKQ